MKKEDKKDDIPKMSKEEFLERIQNFDINEINEFIKTKGKQKQVNQWYIYRGKS